MNGNHNNNFDNSASKNKINSNKDEKHNEDLKNEQKNCILNSKEIIKENDGGGQNLQKEKTSDIIKNGKDKMTTPEKEILKEKEPHLENADGNDKNEHNHSDIKKRRFK
jgi:hypothetical protein